MESFIFSEINKASRNKDISKIKYYGPYASALSYIINCGLKKRFLEKKKTNTIVYRGLKLTESELTDRFKVGSKISLQGYTSTTLSRNTALTFATSKDESDTKSNQSTISEAQIDQKVPVLFQIQLPGRE